MTPREQAFIARVRRRAATLEPALARAYLEGFEQLRLSLSVEQMARLIETGALDRLLGEHFSDQQIADAFTRLRGEILDSVRYATEQMAREIPKAFLVASRGISFDYLNPRVIEAVRTMQDRMMTTLSAEIRDGVRAFVEDGLARGVNPRTTARHLRTIIGIAPNQQRAVTNFRNALESGNTAKALSYKLRDKRFDRTVERMDTKPLTREQIDNMVQAYERRMYAFNAETNARTAALDAQKLGQRLSWEDAIGKGVVERGQLRRRWVTVGDDRVRPEHEEMNGQVVGFDDHFSNGELVPGDSTFNCRCQDVVFLARKEAA